MTYGTILKAALSYKRPNCAASGRAMMVEYDPAKLEARTRGPYRITRAFTNGAVQLQMATHVQETVSTRKIYPYRGP